MDEADAVSVKSRDSGLGIRDSEELDRGFSESRIPNPQSRLCGPQRIVCLTEEPTEVLYALGEQDRIVGISGFTVRPPRARKEKPKVSAFTSAKIDEILKLEPDFVVGFSDIQADIAAELVRRGVEVWISNHRSVAGIVDYVRRLGALVGAAEAANAYADELQRGRPEKPTSELPALMRISYDVFCLKKKKTNKQQ